MPFKPPSINDPGVGPILNGLVAVILSLIVWRFTGSSLGWIALFAPGAILIFWGWIVALRHKR
jgi:membrane-bound ClpP family serine protease